MAAKPVIPSNMTPYPGNTVVFKNPDIRQWKTLVHEGSYPRALGGSLDYSAMCEGLETTHRPRAHPDKGPATPWGRAENVGKPRSLAWPGTALGRRGMHDQRTSSPTQNSAVGPPPAVWWGRDRTKLTNIGKRKQKYPAAKVKSTMSGIQLKYQACKHRGKHGPKSRGQQIKTDGEFTHT